MISQKLFYIFFDKRPGGAIDHPNAIAVLLDAICFAFFHTLKPLFTTICAGIIFTENQFKSYTGHKISLGCFANRDNISAGFFCHCINLWLTMRKLICKI